MYSINDYVMYASDGVCKITEIAVKDLNSKNAKYYVLKPVFSQTSTIYVPVDNEILLQRMRPVLSSSEISKIIDAAKCTENEIDWINDENTRKIAFRDIIRSGNRTEILKLMHSLYVHRVEQSEKGKKFHLCDERLMKEAENLICGEFAFVLGINPNEVLDFITSRISDGEELGNAV